MKFIFSLLLIALAGTTACQSPGSKLEPNLMSQIHEGTTTRAEVENVFGPPDHVLTGANQKTLTLHRYQLDQPNPGWHGAAQGNAGSIMLRSLTALYNTNQIVEKFLYDQSSTVVQRDREGVLIGWSPGNADFTKIIKGITSRGEILQWYGPPTAQTLTIDGDRMLSWSFLRKGRFRSQERDQMFRVVIDDEDFVKNFEIRGNTDARVD